MSAAPTPAGRPPWGWLPAWLRPRSAEVPGSGQLRLVETTLLVLVGVLLAVATVNDVVRQTNVNHRLIADLRTWRAYTGHGYHNLSIEQELFGAHSGREVKALGDGFMDRLQNCTEQPQELLPTPPN